MPDENVTAISHAIVCQAMRIYTSSIPLIMRLWPMLNTGDPTACNVDARLSDERKWAWDFPGDFYSCS